MFMQKKQQYLEVFPKTQVQKQKTKFKCKLCGNTKTPLHYRKDRIKPWAEKYKLPSGGHMCYLCYRKRNAARKLMKNPRRVRRVGTIKYKPSSR